MAQLEMFKVSALPSVLVPNAIYFVRNGAYAEAFLTDSTGNVATEIGNSTMINELIAAAGGGGGSNLTFTAQNKDSITLIKGTPVATHSSGTGFIRTNASDNVHTCIGLLAEDIAAGVSGKVQIGGMVQLSDWSALIGFVSLSSKGIYFIGTSVGQLTTTPPSIAGQVIQQVGKAVAGDTLEISILYPILL